MARATMVMIGFGLLALACQAMASVAFVIEAHQPPPAQVKGP